MLRLWPALFAFVLSTSAQGASTLTPRTSQQPSFDCAKARLASARLICADADLARLDGELGKAFRTRLEQSAGSDRDSLVSDQRAWIGSRDRTCGLSKRDKAPLDAIANAKPCMHNALQARLTALQAGQGSERISNSTLRSLLEKYKGLVANASKAVREREESKSSDYTKQVVETEESLLGALAKATPTDRRLLVRAIADARIEVDHRNPLPFVHQALAEKDVQGALLALDVGQIMVAQNAIQGANTADAATVRTKTSIAIGIVKADSPQWSCAGRDATLCTSLYSLLGLPPLSAGRLRALGKDVRTRRARESGGPLFPDPKQVNAQPFAQFIYGDAAESKPLIKPFTQSTAKWQQRQVPAQTAEKLAQLTSADAATILQRSEQIIDALLADQVIRDALGWKGKFINGAAKQPEDQTNDAPGDSDDSTSVTLQDVVISNGRVFLVTRLEEFLTGGMALIEVPQQNGNSIWFWTAGLNAGSLSYATGRLGDKADKLLFVATTESTGGYLTLWIADPARRRSTQLFKDEQAYHGQWFTADVDGSGEHKLFVSMATGDRRYDDCNQCPSRIETLVLRYEHASGALKQLSRHVSWNDLGFGANRNLFGLGPEVGRQGLGAEIGRGMAALAKLPPGDDEAYRVAVAEILDAINRLHRGKAHAEASLFALRLREVLGAKSAFKGRADLIAYASAIATEASLAGGNAEVGMQVLLEINPDTIENVQLRGIVAELKLEVVRRAGGLDELYRAIGRMRADRPEAASSSYFLADYLLRVGDAEGALQAVRVASDKRTSQGEDWTDDLYMEALTLTKMEKYDAAVASLTLLLRRSGDHRESSLTAKALLVAADIAIRQEYYDVARHLLDTSLAKMDAVAWAEEGPSVLLLYGRLLRKTGQLTQSRRALAAALRVAAGSSGILSALHDEMATTLEAAGGSQGFLASSQAAFDTIVNRQTTVNEEVHKLSFVSANADIAARHIARLLKQTDAKPETVLNALESWRAQVLRSMRRRAVPLLEPSRTPADVVSSFARGNVGYVSYYFGAAKSVAVVMEAGKARLVPLEINAEQLARHRGIVQSHMDVTKSEPRDFIWQDQMPPELRSSLTSLRKNLIDALGLPAVVQTVIVVPDEQLYWVPWAALGKASPEAGEGSAALRSLFEDVVVLVTPSGLLMNSGTAELEKRFFVLGSSHRIEDATIKGALSDMFLARPAPTLPALTAAPEEVETIQKALSGTMQGEAIVLRDSLDRQQHPRLIEVLQAAERSSIVHLAAHGMFNSHNPMASVLFLSPFEGGVLRASDFAGANLSRAALVSLSACQTGVADVQAGGEALGFVRGLMIAGAQRVLLTGWTVESRPTRLFFGSMYARIAGGATFLEAYRATVLEFSKRFRHPFYWAAYTMYSSETR